MTFISVYVLVMRPICCALDILQGDKAVGMGYLLPTISVLSQQLDELENRIQNPLILCGPLVVALKQGISKRFEPLIVKPDAQLAAVVHPQFKLDWITDDAQKSALVEMLKRRVRALISCSTADGQADGSLSVDICGAGTSDFLARISAAKKQRIENTADDAGTEADRYLADSCT